MTMKIRIILTAAALLGLAACSAPSPDPSNPDQAACVNFSNALHYGDTHSDQSRSEITRLAGEPSDPELAQHQAEMFNAVGKRLPWSIAAVQFADRCDSLFTNLMIDRDKL